MGLFSSGSADSPTLSWQALKNNDGSSQYTYRTKISGGWLVSMSNQRGAGLTFVPDPDHKWDGNSIAD